jgi:hypothetical protein
MPGSEHAPCDPGSLLERRHGLAKIIECGAVVFVERPCVMPLSLEREVMRVTEDALRHRDRFVHQFLGLFEAL